jgi:capsular exopolysaccharide synthesis family protein
MRDISRYLFAYSKPGDPVAEAYRAIRTSLLFSSTEEQPLRALAIASAGPQEGKTTTVCNLGVVLSQTGKKVLLVDGDIRKPRLQDVFRSKARKGLSDFLSGQEVFGSLIHPTAVDNLFVVYSGFKAPNPSELISTSKMREFIVSARERFDFVLVDTPPLCAVTDGAILSRIVDGVIVVVCSGKTSKRAVPKVDQILNSAQARIVGMIPNAVSTASEDVMYYYYSR